MVSEAELMFQLGAIMLLAFIAATMAGKLNQSVMIGYIIIGAFIGPKISFEVFGIEYTGLVRDTTLIEAMAQISLRVLSDLKRMSSPEVDFLIGLVVVETFIAMTILAVASGMVLQPTANPAGYGQLIVGIAAFYGFFVWMAVWAVPRGVKFFNSIENDELFILFALGIVFLTY